MLLKMLSEKTSSLFLSELELNSQFHMNYSLLKLRL